MTSHDRFDLLGVRKNHRMKIAVKMKVMDDKNKVGRSFTAVRRTSDTMASTLYFLSNRQKAKKTNFPALRLSFAKAKRRTSEECEKNFNNVCLQ